MRCEICGNTSLRDTPFCFYCGNQADLQGSPDNKTSNSFSGTSIYGTSARMATNERISVEDSPRPTLTDMHQWMAELLHYIRYSLLVPCLEAILNADRARAENERENRVNFERSLEAAETWWQHAKHEHQNRQNKSQFDLNSARSSYNDLMVNLRFTRDKAYEHLRKLRVELPVLTLQSTPYTNEVTPYELANSYARAAQESVNKLVTIQRPDFLWWNGSDFFLGLILALFGGATVVAFMQIKSMNDAWPLYLWSGTIMMIGLLSGIYVWRKYSITSKLVYHFAEFSQNERNAQFYLDHYLRHAEDTFKRDAAQQALYLDREKAKYEEAKARAEEIFSRESLRIEAEYRNGLSKCKEEYTPMIEEARKMCGQFYYSSGFAGANWNDRSWLNWQSLEFPALSYRIGTLNTGIYDLQPVMAPPEVEFSLSAMLSFRSEKCLLFESTGEAKKRAIDALQSVMLRLLATIPPGKLRFTLIDPVGLGQNVASFMALADHDENLIGSKAWTEPRHIEQRLAEITEHMETVIQKYLRKDFATIEDYNNHAGEVAEPYRALVVVDFPVNFTADAARRLVSVAQNGARCGVHTFVVRDTAKPLPHGFNMKDLEQAATVISAKSDQSNNAFIWKDERLGEYEFEIDDAPPSECLDNIIRETGEKAKSGMAVKVPYSKLLQIAGLTEEHWWRTKSAEEIKTPLGPTGARKAQYLTMGKGMAHHSVIIGRTGSGKSNLMHVIITSLALTYSPDEIQLYLIDFKQGVEFKPYAEKSLPHARVIAIQSEREFGMSVLQGLDEELKSRGDLFRANGVENISNYRKKTNDKLPRILLMVDEFQEFFTFDDSISRNAAIILDRLVRQGRSAGIHVMMGSQTLAGHKLPSGLLGQMAIRIALQCSEADSRLILSDDNPAARLLSRPGEAYYNDQGGLVEGNNLFQVALFTEEDREEYLTAILDMRARSKKSYEQPIVFEGNEPARFENCKPIEDLLQASDWESTSKTVEAFIGEAIAIRPPTSVRFRRQAGNNLLVITREEEEGIGILASSITSLAVQKDPDDIQFSIIDFSTADTPWENLLDEMASLLPHQVCIARRRDIVMLLSSLTDELNQRVKAERVEGPELFLVIQGLQRARDLRPDESSASIGIKSKLRGEELPPNPNQMFMALLRDGPDVGIHVIVWSDTVSNALKVDRSLIRECGLRIGSRMSAEDSNKLFDDTVAAKLDKPHRAVFLDEERTGAYEKFRPYAIPSRENLSFIAKQLRERVSRERMQWR